MERHHDNNRRFLVPTVSPSPQCVILGVGRSPESKGRRNLLPCLYLHTHKEHSPCHFFLR
jgi:hypothetical protein